jgi:hypothetical protein
LWQRLLTGVRASTEPQRLYPRLGLVLRTMYLGRRALAHFRRMDFSIFPGWTGYVFWRAGIVGLWQRRFTPRAPRPERAARRAAVVPSIPVELPSPAKLQ